MATVPLYTGFVPARNQAQDVFNTSMAQYFSYIANLAPSINTVAEEINSTAVTVAQSTAEEAAARTAVEVEAALSEYVTDASGFANDASSSATLASNLADATAANTATYTSVSAGLADTVDTNYFRVIEAPEAARINVYRNDVGSATFITTYYTKTGVDAKQAAAVRLGRSLQRLGDNGQTLHSDFNLAAYGLGTPLFGGVQDAMEAEELWEVERLSGTLALQHVADGSKKYVYVPPNVLAREYNPATGRYQVQDSPTVTNEILWSEPSGSNRPITNNMAHWSGTPVEYAGITLDKYTRGTVSFEDVPSTSQTATFSTFFYDGGEDLNSNRVIRGELNYQSSGVVFANAEFNYATKQFSLTQVSGSGDADLDVLNIGGGVYRVQLTLTSTQDVDTHRTAIYGENKWLGGIQLNSGGRAPYVRTEGSPVTRDADVLRRQLDAEFDSNSWSIGVFYIQQHQPGGTFGSTLWSLSKTAARDANRSMLFVDSSGALRFEYWNGGVRQVNLTSSAGLISIGAQYNIVVSFSDSAAVMYCNGDIIDSVTAIISPVQHDYLYLNANWQASPSNLNSFDHVYLTPSYRELTQ